jgi:hypothetical protein
LRSLHALHRVVISHATIRIQLSEVADGSDGPRILTLPWTRPSPYRKREILQGADDAKTYARPMPANARAILIEALRDAHRWLDELLSDPRLALESLASRESKTSSGRVALVTWADKFQPGDKRGFEAQRGLAR